jgi:hypothetical protein
VAQVNVISKELREEDAIQHWTARNAMMGIDPIFLRSWKAGGVLTLPAQIRKGPANRNGVH